MQTLSSNREKETEKTYPSFKSSTTMVTRSCGGEYNQTANQRDSTNEEQNSKDVFHFQQLAPDISCYPNSPPCSPGKQPVIDEKENSTHDPQFYCPSTSLPFANPAIRNTRNDTCSPRLQDFCILRTLGTGSFGRVHLTRSTSNDQYYALKVLRKEVVVRLKQIEHTNNERNVVMNVSHPFIVNGWGTFQDDANLYMVMDFVPGGELFSYLRKSQRFTDDTARFYAAEVLLAFAYLHSRDIIYRDLKPENLLLDAEGHIKITDFGFAKRVSDVTWTLCGTPDYLAPEIIQSKGYGKAVDFWALGILIYEMLAGFPPFYDDSQFKLYEKIVQGRLQFPSHFSPGARDLLSHLLTPDLSSRYGNLKRGYLDILEHPWFASMDFNLLEQRKIKPPITPKLQSEGDSSNYDKYEEQKEIYGTPQPDPYRDLFPNF